VEFWRQGQLKELVYLASTQDPAAGKLIRLTLRKP